MLIVYTQFRGMWIARWGNFKAIARSKELAGLHLEIMVRDSR